MAGGEQLRAFPAERQSIVKGRTVALIGKQIRVVRIIDNHQPAPGTFFAEGCLDRGLGIRLIVIDPLYTKRLPNLPVGIFKRGRIHDGHPEDRTLGV